MSTSTDQIDDMSTRPSGIAVIVPARNEGDQLGATLAALATQDRRPDRIVVVVNNSTDLTRSVAEHAATAYRGQVRIDVLVMERNSGKKAGALNAGLSHLRAETPSRTLAQQFSLVVTMDADTVLAPEFLRRAERIMANPVLGGVSAACRGKTGVGTTPWQRTLTLFQRIEYGRYGFTRVRTNVHTMSGAGSVYRAVALDGQRNAHGYYFDTASLVEDYALTLDLKAAGWKITTNQHLVAYTDLMPTLRLLLAQRDRWTRGTVTELRYRGWTRHTASSIIMLILGLLGIAYTAVWATVSVQTYQRFGFHLEAPYLAWMAFWVFYQVYSVRHLGWRIVLFEVVLIPELLFGLLRNFWLLRSIAVSYSRSALALVRRAFRAPARTKEEVWI